MYKDSLILAKVMASSYMRVNLQGLIGCCAVWCVSSTPITQLSLHTHPTSSFKIGFELAGIMEHQLGAATRSPSCLASFSSHTAAQWIASP